MVWIPRGPVSRATIDGVIDAIAKEEALAQEHFDRFSDFSHVNKIDLDFEYVFKASLARRLAHRRGPKVKSAMIVGSMEARHYTKLYAMVTEHSALEVRVFAERKEAAAWLGCAVDLLDILEA